jgi:hypothetical protein
MKNLFTISFAVFVFFGSFSFSQPLYSQGKPKGMVKIKGSPPENFFVFYDRFHRDSLFQISRIRDPLFGMKKLQGQEIPWKIKDWDLMTTRVQDMDSSIYKTKIKQKKKFFEQEVWSSIPEYYAAHRFELHGSKWYLVFAFEESF